MKMRLMTLLLGGLAVISPFEIKISERPPSTISVVKLFAYDPLTAEFIDFTNGMKILSRASINADYDTLYKQLKEAGYNFPYSPPSNFIKSEERIVRLDILGIENLGAPKVIVIEKSQRAYILYQLLTGRIEISRVGLDEIRYGLKQKIIFSNMKTDDPDTLTLNYLLRKPEMACIEFMTLALSILWSYGESAEGGIVIGKKNGHAFVKWKGLIIDDEQSAGERWMMKNYKKIWGTDVKIVVAVP